MKTFRYLLCISLLFYLYSFAQEQKIGLNEIPTDVKTSVSNAFPDHKIIHVNRQNGKEEKYIIQVKKGEQSKTIITSKSGVIVHQSKPLDPTLLPNKLKTTLQKDYQDYSIISASEELNQDKQKFFSITLKSKTNKKLNIKLNLQGAVRHSYQQMSNEELPEPIKNTIKQDYPNAKIVHIGYEKNLSRPDGAYNVVLRIGENSQHLRFNRDGKTYIDRRDRNTVNLDQLPKSILRVIKDRFPNYKLKRLNKMTEGNLTTYSCLLQKEDLSVQIHFDQDANIKSLAHTLNQEKIDTKYLDIIKKHYPDYKIKEIIERHFPHTKFFAFKLNKADINVEVGIKFDGSIFYSQTQYQKEDLPKDVQAVIDNELEGFHIHFVAEKKDDKVYFFVHAQKDNKPAHMAITKDADIIRLDKHIMLESLPNIVNETIRNKHPEATYNQVKYLIKEQGIPHYEVNLTANKKTVILRIDRDGNELTQKNQIANQGFDEWELQKLLVQEDYIRLPNVIQKAINNEFPLHQLVQIQKKDLNGLQLYQLKFHSEEFYGFMIIDIEGNLKTKHIEIGVHQVPHKILNALKKRYPKAHLDSCIFISHEKNQEFYQFHINGEHNVKQVKFSNDGIELK